MAQDDETPPEVTQEPEKPAKKPRKPAKPKARDPKTIGDPGGAPPSNGNGIRSNSVEEERRFRAVMDLMVMGADRTEILHSATEEGWRMSMRAIEAYMAKCRIEINRILDLKREDHLAGVLRRRHRYSALAVANGDIKTALASDDSFAKLCNLFPATVVRSENKEIPSDEPPKRLNLDELKLLSVEIARDIQEAEGLREGGVGPQ